MDKKTNQGQFSVGLWAFLMSLGTVISRFFGFFRDLAIAAFFTRTQTDIFFVAFRLPNFFRRFLGEGSFSASVTPVLTESLCEDKGEVKARQISSALFTLVFSIASLLSLLGVIFMEDLMNLFFQGTPYSSVEGKLQWTVLTGRVVFAYLFLVAGYSYFMSVAHAFGKFFLPALAPALFNLTMVVFAFLPQEWWPFPALGLAWGVIIGGMAQLSLALLVVYKLGFWPSLSFAFRDKAVLSALKRFVPASLGLSGLAVIGLLNVYFAGWLEEGAHTYIYYGDRLLEFPRSLIAISLGTALVPELSRFHAMGKKKEFFQVSSRSLDFLFFLVLPCAIGFYFLPEPIVSLLFERGQFGKEAVSQTTLVLQINAMVLIFSAAARVMVSGFFAVNKNWHCAACNLIYVLFHGLCGWFLTGEYGLKGLVFATALSSCFYFFLLLSAFSYFIGSLRLWQRVLSLVKIIPGLFLFAVISLCFGFFFSFFNALFPVGWSQFLSLLLILSVGGIGYLFLGVSFKHPAAKETVDGLKRIGIRFFPN